MQKRAPDSHRSHLSLSPGSGREQVQEKVKIKALRYCFEDWIDSGEYQQQQSPRTLEEKKGYIGRFFWFLELRKIEEVGVSEIRKFLAYLTNGHTEPGGRWGNPQCNKPMRPVSVRNYYVYLQGLFGYVVAEGYLSESPFTRLSPPIVRLDQPRVFTDEQVLALLEAAAQSHHPVRDVAILMLMIDTGFRASEICSLKVGSFDMDTRHVRVLGKGNKERSSRLGPAAYKVIYQFLQESGKQPGQFVFCCDRGISSGEPLSRGGLLKLFTRLGKVAGIKGPCSPHMMRRYFSVTFLKPIVTNGQIVQDGGNPMALKEMLGHTTLTMTNRYVVLSQIDFDSQHRVYSPADRLTRRKLRK